MGFIAAQTRTALTNLGKLSGEICGEAFSVHLSLHMLLFADYLHFYKVVTSRRTLSPFFVPCKTAKSNTDRRSKKR